MDPIMNILVQLGLGVAANSVYDLLKGLSANYVDKQTFIDNVQNRIAAQGLSVRAETVIKALAANGFLTIEGSHLYAGQSLVFGSLKGGALMGDNSSFETDRTAINAGSGAYLQTKGNAQVRQNDDGSISFHVGEDGGISIGFMK